MAEFQRLNMKRTNLLKRWGRLSRSRKLLVTEAAVALAAASAAVRLMPFKRAVRLGSRRLSKPDTHNLADELSWAVESAGRNVPWRVVCIQKGIALQWMLRRRGIDALLHYGVARDDGGDLQAHVWVAADDRVLIGGEEAGRFQRVATFP